MKEWLESLCAKVVAVDEECEWANSEWFGTNLDAACEAIEAIGEDPNVQPHRTFDLVGCLVREVERLQADVQRLQSSLSATTGALEVLESGIEDYVPRGGILAAEEITAEAEQRRLADRIARLERLADGHSHIDTLGSHFI